MAELQATKTTRAKAPKTRTTHRLTATTVRSARDGKHADGHGLYLHVNGQRRRWIFNYTSPTAADASGRPKRREMGLGPAGTVTLATARDLAADARQKLAKGIDPLDAATEAKAQAAAVPTFAAAATAYIDRKANGWRNAKHRQQWRNTIDTYCKPIAGKKVDAVTVKDVQAVLVQPITDKGHDGVSITLPFWIARHETAQRLRGRIEAIMRAEIAAGHAPGPNPAANEMVAPVLPELTDEQKAVTHQRALAYAEVPAFILALRERQGEAVAALAAEFLTLTAARTGEVLGAIWREIDMQAEGGPVWTVPASRMKMKKAHRVPLTARAVAILDRVKGLTGGAPDAPLFPSPRRKGVRPAPLSQMALLVLLRRMGWAERTTMHGLRSSFRVWAAAETNVPREVCEAALAHVNRDKVEAAYQRGDHLERRRKLMAAWDSWLERGARNDSAGRVVQMRAVTP